jgi:hypothetical protein
MTGDPSYETFKSYPPSSPDARNLYNSRPPVNKYRLMHWADLLVQRDVRLTVFATWVLHVTMRGSETRRVASSISRGLPFWITGQLAGPPQHAPGMWEFALRSCNYEWLNHRANQSPVTQACVVEQHPSRRQSPLHRPGCRYSGRTIQATDDTLSTKLRDPGRRSCRAALMSLGSPISSERHKLMTPLDS